MKGSKSDAHKDKGLNPLVRLVARMQAPIRVKLLVAFFVVVGLMIALALTGMSELRKANIRAAELVDDQVRIGTLRSVQESLQNVKLVAGEMFLNQGNDEQNKKLAMRFYDELFLFGAASSQTGNPNRATRFLNSETEADFFPIVRHVEVVASKMRRLFVEGDILAARAVYDTEFAEAVDDLNRVVFSIYFDLRQGMRARADENEAAYERARRLILTASGTAVALALILGFGMSASITRPLNRIRFALGELSGGAFDARVSVANRDEMGELASHVNQTSAKLGALYDEVEAQKNQLEGWNAELETKVTAQVTEIERANRLRRFLPEQVADLLTGSESEAEALATKRGEITVLFADLRGFTGFASQATPQQVVDALNTFHATCGPLIEARGGTLERFLGDALMVLFGAPLPVEDPAGRAVALARDMQEAVREAMASFRAGDRPLGLGIGIGTGAATLGQIGFEGRMDYSAIGPAPNLAARLCDVATDGQILISHATAWQVDADMKSAGPFDLKGIGPEIAAFELS